MHASAQNETVTQIYINFLICFPFLDFYMMIEVYSEKVK